MSVNMVPEPDRFAEAIRRIDAANAEDPARVTVDGRPVPAELHYAMRMSAWLEQVEPNASEALRIAVRAQHLRRWDIPRAQFPMTRVGYLQWRTTLGKYHADVAAALLRDVGYDEETIERVGSIVRKERIKSDPEAQALEDVACLVFLEVDYVDFARTHDADKVTHILRRTWKKMSERGRALALAMAPRLPAAERALIERALSGAGSEANPGDRAEGLSP